MPMRVFKRYIHRLIACFSMNCPPKTSVAIGAHGMKQEEFDGQTSIHNSTKPSFTTFAPQCQIKHCGKSSNIGGATGSMPANNAINADVQKRRFALLLDGGYGEVRQPNDGKPRRSQ